MRRKYTLDENFFDKIDSPIKAQILGFIYADGCNNLYDNKIAICLAKEDKYYLEKIRENLQSNQPLYFRKKPPEKGQDSYSLVIGCKRFCEKLNLLGCPPRKSQILKFPSNKIISDDIIHHFIRGYFEGDGSISKVSKKKNQFSFNLIGTIDFCVKCAEFIKKNTEVHIVYYKIKRCNNMMQLGVYGNKQVYRVMKWLYNQAPFVMNRKYERYDIIRKKYEEFLIT